MLRDNLWYNFGDAAVTEVMQCLDEGRDAAAYMAEAREIDAMELVPQIELKQPDLAQQLATIYQQ